MIRTVGHSNRPLGAFLAILAAHRVEILVDVRSVPWSRRWPWFRKRELAVALEARGIGYVYQGRSLGGRTESPGPASPEDFQAAVDDVHALARESRLALMCAEADPARCHRARLLAPAFERCGVRVIHLMGPDATEEHCVTERRMNPRSPVVRDLFD